jgi:hypothetical protein
MSEFEVTRRLGAQRHAVFGVLADPARLPEWLAELPHIETDGSALRIRLRDTLHDLNFQVAEDQGRAEFGAAGGGGYAGWVQLADTAADACDATAHLSLMEPGGGDYGTGRAGTEGLERALERLDALVSVA